MLLQTIGERLTHKPFEGISWWWDLGWGTCISIHPELTQETPLWNRDERSLKKLRLFQQSPDELHAEIARYWEKPFWRRCLLRLLTSIGRKIRVWAYYQQCLSFREARKHYPFVEHRVARYEPKHPLIHTIVATVNRDSAALEQRLEKYAGNHVWIQQHLRFLLAQHENKRYRSFLKLMDKHVKKLPPDCNQALVRQQLEQDYQELEKMLSTYLNAWCQPATNQEASPSPVEENLHRDLVCVGPTVVSEHVASPSFDRELNHSMSAMHEWLTLKRQSLEVLVKQTPPSYETIQLCLEESLQHLSAFIESQLSTYERAVNDVRRGRMNYKEALPSLEYFQNRLFHLFRKSGLLFHPDKSDSNETIGLIKTECFQAFQPLTENSFKRIDKNLTTLKQCIPQWELAWNKRLEAMERDRTEFRAWFEQKYAKIMATQAEIKTENAEIKTENAEIKTENAEIKEKQARMEATLNQLLRQMATPNAAETSRASSSHSETSAEPRTHFFARP